MNREITLRVTGFAASLVLTLIAYFIIVNHEYFNFDVKTAVLIIVFLAFVQSVIQLIFFINVWKEKGELWNLGVFISTASIIFIIIYFSIWIINNLNYNMM